MTYQKKRNTAETQLNITLANDASESNINTGVGFLDHMLTLFSFHSHYLYKLKQMVIPKLMTTM